MRSWRYSVPNGAGKTTTLLTLAGELPPLEGAVAINGEVTKAALHQRARNGLTFVTEEKSVFMGMTTKDNLRVDGVMSTKRWPCSPNWVAVSMFAVGCSRAVSSRC